MTKTVLTSLLLLGSTALGAQTLSSVRELSSTFGVWDDNRTPFSVEATVSAPVVFDQEQAAVPLTDDTGSCAIRGNLPPGTMPPELGERIRVSGILRKRDTGFPSASFTIERLGRAAVRPEPTAVSIADLRTGAHDWQYTRITGLVCDVLPSDTNANWIFLVLCQDGHTITVAIPLNATPHADFDTLRTQIRRPPAISKANKRSVMSASRNGLRDPRRIRSTRRVFSSLSRKNARCATDQMIATVWRIDTCLSHAGD